MYDQNIDDKRDNEDKLGANVEREYSGYLVLYWYELGLEHNNAPNYRVRLVCEIYNIWSQMLSTK